MKKKCFGSGSLLILCLMTQNACGVKGDPVPPVTPAEIGRGKPLYKSDDESNNAPASIRKPPADQKDDRDNEE